MKRLLAILMATLLVLTFMAACSKEKPKAETKTDVEQPANENTDVDENTDTEVETPENVCQICGAEGARELMEDEKNNFDRLESLGADPFGAEVACYDCIVDYINYCAEYSEKITADVEPVSIEEFVAALDETSRMTMNTQEFTDARVYAEGNVVIMEYAFIDFDDSFIDAVAQAYEEYYNSIDTEALKNTYKAMCPDVENLIARYYTTTGKLVYEYSFY